MSRDPQSAMLDFYNLKKDPFKTPDAYSPVGKRHELLEQLIHLNQFSHMALGVLAPKGYGKTTLFKLLSKQLQMQTDIQVVTFSPEGPISGIDLLQQLAVSWHLDDVADEKQLLLRQLRSHNLAHSAMGLRHSILIDDAEKLGQDGLETLHELVSGLPEEQAIGLTLFCKEGAVDLRSIYKPAESLHLIHLQALSNIDVFGFIQDHFIAAGHKQGLPFPAEVIEKLYIASEGIPSEVKKLTHEYMVAQAMEMPDSPKGSIPKLHILSISGLVLIILGSLLFQIFNNEKPKDDEDAKVLMLSDRLSTNAVVEKLNDAVAKVEARQVEPSNRASSESTSSVEIPVTLSKPEPIAANSVSPAVEATVDTAQMVEQDASTTGTSDVVEQSDSVDSITVVVPDQQVPEKTPGWIYLVDAKSFTIQLLGTRTEKSAKEFIDNQLRSDSFRFHKTIYKGADWYVVTYGLFEEKVLAENAIQMMPDSLKKQKPWIRSIQSLRDSSS